MYRVDPGCEELWVALRGLRQKKSAGPEILEMFTHLANLHEQIVLFFAKICFAKKIRRAPAEPPPPPTSPFDPPDLHKILVFCTR